VDIFIVSRALSPPTPPFNSSPFATIAETRARILCWKSVLYSSLLDCEKIYLSLYSSFPGPFSFFIILSPLFLVLRDTKVC